jgi:hypothetical protein
MLVTETFGGLLKEPISEASQIRIVNLKNCTYDEQQAALKDLLTNALREIEVFQTAARIVNRLDLDHDAYSAWQKIIDVKGRV